MDTAGAIASRDLISTVSFSDSPASLSAFHALRSSSLIMDRASETVHARVQNMTSALPEARATARTENSKARQDEPVLLAPGTSLL